MCSCDNQFSFLSSTRGAGTLVDMVFNIVCFFLFVFIPVGAYGSQLELKNAPVNARSAEL